MSRCNICDYLEGYGSDLYSIPNDHRKVRFRHKFNEYQCDECYDEYTNLTYNYNAELPIEEEELREDSCSFLQESMSESEVQIE